MYAKVNTSIIKKFNGGQIMDNTNNKNSGIPVSILDKEFIIACPQHAQEELRAAAHFLDMQMRNIRQTGRVIGAERIAIMAALNISHELLALQNGPQTELADDLKERLRFLSQKIDDVLLDSNIETLKEPKKEFENEYADS